MLLVRSNPPPATPPVPLVDVAPLLQNWVGDSSLSVPTDLGNLMDGNPNTFIHMGANSWQSVAASLTEDRRVREVHLTASSWAGDVPFADIRFGGQLVGTFTSSALASVVWNVDITGRDFLIFDPSGSRLFPRTLKLMAEAV